MEAEETKSEEATLKLTRENNVVTISMFEHSYPLEFSTEEDAFKAESLGKYIMKMIEGLINMGATLLQVNENDDIEEKEYENQEM